MIASYSFGSKYSKKHRKDCCVQNILLFSACFGRYCHFVRLAACIGGLKVFVLREFGVAPQVFNVVKFTGFPVENMHDRVETVHANPTGSSHTFDVIRWLAQFFLEPLVYIPCDGLDLRRGIPLTDDEEIRRPIVQFSEVKFYDVFSFDVLDTVNDKVVQLFHVGGGRF